MKNKIKRSEILSWAIFTIIVSSVFLYWRLTTHSLSLYSIIDALWPAAMCSVAFIGILLNLRILIRKA
ncbi:hypothetical protein SAMN06273570_5164 [Candidatus Pantoea floridensis]|uniref:Uncharacterized protein n=1 Tax=Candidatus Pantoea floridensis TaxID=1938870 RepID=A0A286DS34_9GAMM|nr:hypothetical protein BX596_5153 [Enterobacteriaceae bacterium JKS000233]SOD61497.1 hypothetical protein SAMN06273570_5164 [Pantoea floridensis]